MTEKNDNLSEEQLEEITEIMFELAQPVRDKRGRTVAMPLVQDKESMEQAYRILRMAKDDGIITEAKYVFNLDRMARKGLELDLEDRQLVDKYLKLRDSYNF